MAIVSVGSSVLLAVNEAALSEVMTAANARDTRGFLDLMLEGKVFSIDDLTEVKVIENGLMKCRVRVMGGEMAGRSGWIAREFLKPRFP